MSMMDRQCLCACNVMNETYCMDEHTATEDHVRVDHQVLCSFHLRVIFGLYIYLYLHVRPFNYFIPIVLGFWT
jgi:hypothetical protein